MIKEKTVVVLFFFILCACAQNKKVTVNVTALKPYCGGARPTPDMVKASETPVPFSHKTMILLRSDGKIDSVRTDEGGKLDLRLKKGKYQLFETWRYYKLAPGNRELTAFNKECLTGEWKQPYKVITVSKSGFTVRDSAAIIQYCDWRLPCITDDGNGPVPD